MAEENGKKRSVQERCNCCGRFLLIQDTQLCPKCYRKFWKWCERNWERLTKKHWKLDKENPLTEWLRKTKEKK